MGTWTHPALAEADCPLAAKTLWSFRGRDLQAYSGAAERSPRRGVLTHSTRRADMEVSPPPASQPDQLPDSGDGPRSESPAVHGTGPNQGSAARSVSTA